MKFFYKGKLVESYGKGKKMEMKTKTVITPFTPYFILGKSKLGQAKLKNTTINLTDESRTNQEDL